MILRYFYLKLVFHGFGFDAAIWNLWVAPGFCVCAGMQLGILGKKSEFQNGLGGKDPKSHPIPALSSKDTSNYPRFLWLTPQNLALGFPEHFSCSSKLPAQKSPPNFSGFSKTDKDNEGQFVQILQIGVFQLLKIQAHQFQLHPKKKKQYP